MIEKIEPTTQTEELEEQLAIVKEQLEEVNRQIKELEDHE